MIIAALVLIAVAVGVVVLVGGGGDDGLDAAGAADGFAALSDDAEYDGGYVELRRCPLGDPQDLGERVVDTLDLADDVVDGDTYQYMSDRTDDLPESLWCVAGADLSGESDADTVAFTASRLPGDDYDRFLEDTLPDGNVEVGDPQGYRGGTIYPYCFDPDDETLGPSGCGADWVAEDDDIAIGLSYTSGDDGDPDAAVDALKDVLPDLVDALADQA